MSLQPNQRAQDGIKRHWLCSPCETVLSRSERSFATQFFHPYLEASDKRFHYGAWLIHFCTSSSWRVLRFLYRRRGDFRLPVGGLRAAFGEYINGKANRMAALLEIMSDHQHKKVDVESLEKNGIALVARQDGRRFQRLLTHAHQRCKKRVVFKTNVRVRPRNNPC